MGIMVVSGNRVEVDNPPYINRDSTGISQVFMEILGFRRRWEF